MASLDTVWMPTLALLLILCFAAGAVESLQNAPPNFTLGGWPGPALAGTQSIAAALAGVQTLRRNLSCGILVGSGNPGTLWAQVKPNSPSLTNIAAVSALLGGNRTSCGSCGSGYLDECRRLCCSRGADSLLRWCRCC